MCMPFALIASLANLTKHVALFVTLLYISESAESSIYYNKVIRPNNDDCGIKHNFQFEISPSTTTQKYSEKFLMIQINKVYRKI